MRKTKTLTDLLRNIGKLLADESARSPEFASRVESLLGDFPEPKVKVARSKKSEPSDQLPDVHLELTARGETEFRLWLREQPLPTLRAIIRDQDLDPVRRTSRWRDPEKLAGFIADGVHARLSRGSSFTGRA